MTAPVEASRHLDPAPMRPLAPADIPSLARLWHQGWRDGHLASASEGLVRARRLESFVARLEAAPAGEVQVTGPDGAPAGFFWLKGACLDQFYVDPALRGQGLAMPLMLAAEAQLAASGVDIAWLSCVVGNDRAARFYEKAGWHRAATTPMQLQTADGPFDIVVWRYEKRLLP
ncbi:GNAT family N-acetyltransferase (plasmid) [Tistrella mobilis]|uniref:GNAT family N-acetyltransferase n=1 Tax=Tistrella mobilis TaxID=171437 RepID=UPI003556E984